MNRREEKPTQAALHAGDVQVSASRPVTPGYREPRLLLIGPLGERMQGGSRGRYADLDTGYYSIG
jgi:hypothetical protein